MNTGVQDLGVFVASGIIVNIVPGPDSLLVMTRSSLQGWRAGLVAALGIGAGILVHVLVAALGLSALLSAWPSAFVLIKWCGAAYIVFMGVMMLRKGVCTAAASAPALPSFPRIFLQGFLTDVLNPKVALFFLAFVPQFIAADAASKPLAFLVLGLIFDLNCMLWFVVLALGTAYASARIGKSRRLGPHLKRVVGAAFVLMGVRIALV